MRGMKVLSTLLAVVFLVSTAIAAPVEVNRFNKTYSQMKKDMPAGVQSTLDGIFVGNVLTNAMKDTGKAINEIANALETGGIFAKDIDGNVRPDAAEAKTAYIALMKLLVDNGVTESTSEDDLKKIVNDMKTDATSAKLNEAISFNDIITYINGKDMTVGSHEFDNSPETFKLAEQMKKEHAGDLVELNVAGVKVFTLASYGFADNERVLERIINESNIKIVSNGKIDTVYFLPNMSWRAAYADNTAYVFDSLLPNVSSSKDPSVLEKRLDIGSKMTMSEDQVVNAYRYVLSHEATELVMKAQQGELSEEQHAQLVADMLQDPTNSEAAKLIDEVELKDNTERIITYLKSVFGNELSGTRILVSKAAAEQQGFIGIALAALRSNGIDVRVVDGDTEIQNAVQDTAQVMFLDNSNANQAAFTTAVKGSKAVKKSLYAIFDSSFLDKDEYQLAADKALAALLGDMALGTKVVTVDETWALANLNTAAISARLLDVSEKNNLTNAQIQKSISTFA